MVRIEQYQHCCRIYADRELWDEVCGKVKEGIVEGLYPDETLWLTSIGCADGSDWLRRRNLYFQHNLRAKLADAVCELNLIAVWHIHTNLSFLWERYGLTELPPTYNAKTKEYYHHRLFVQGPDYDIISNMRKLMGEEMTAGLIRNTIRNHAGHLARGCAPWRFPDPGGLPDLLKALGLLE